MASNQPPELARCDEHGLVMLEGDPGRLSWCAACALDIEARPDDYPGDKPLSDEEFRNRITAQTLADLVPLVEEYVEDRQDEPEVWLAHKPWEGELPAGYSEQERYVLMVGYKWNNRAKYVSSESSAVQTIEALRANGYGGEP